MNDKKTITLPVEVVREAIELLRSQNVSKFYDWRDADDWLFASLSFTKSQLKAIYDNTDIFVDFSSALEDEPTREMRRCRHCSYLIEDNNGNWICDDCGKDIHDIPDEECSAEQEW